MNLKMLKKAMISYVTNSAKAIWSVIAYPLSIFSKRQGDLKDYRIYGNSVQEGEPTPDNPIEVQSVGELTTKNLLNISQLLTSAVTLNGITAEPYGKGGIRVYGTPTVSGSLINIRVDKKYECFLETGTILRASRSLEPSYNNITGGCTYNFQVGGYSEENKWIVNFQSQASSYTTLTTDVFYMRTINILITPKNTETYIDFVFNPQIEIGTTATEYEPYHKYKVPVMARGKNLFKYIKGAIVNGSIIEELPTGAIVQGKLNPSAGQNAYSKGWFRPGFNSTTAICPVLYTGDTVTISADITLLELIEGDTYTPSIHIQAIDGSKGYTSSPIAVIALNETKRLKKIATITEEGDGKIFYPIFTLNSNTVKIENIQIEYGREATTYEPYIEPQTINIFIDEPIGVGEVVQKSVDNLPNLPQFKGTTVYEVQTDTPPSGIEVCYYI